MKKVLKMMAILLAGSLGLAAYFLVWGGKPSVENFREVSDDYETVAKIALDYYKDRSPGEEYINITIHDGDLKYRDEVLQLTESQKKSAEQAGKKFGYLRVCKDAVFFRVDETGYYGLVYSKNPLSALYEADLPQQGREYHRINSRWYEWGVWGI